MPRAPGFWRAVAIEPDECETVARVEDDMHHMRVALRHDAERIESVKAETIRAPWSICPGAQAVLERTFTGARLADAAQLAGKRQNCTHLFDIAVLAAAHAGEATPLRYDMHVTDPVERRRELTLERDGEPMLHWVEEGGSFTAPDPIVGRSLVSIGDWIATLDPATEEMARLLRGAGIISHGRQIPMDKQSDATVIPANCYTFQPERSSRARRINGIHDFTEAMDRPLDGKPREVALE